MSDGLFVAASAAVARQHELDVVSNNLANVSTDGFQELRVSFESVLSDPYNTETNSQIYVAPTHTATSQQKGPIKQTGSNLDVAINGRGYFAVEAADQQTLYTRSGRFTVNDLGQLATASGHLVLGTSGPISGLNGTVRIEKDGRIFNNEVQVGALQLYDFNEPEKLQRHGHLLFESGPQQAPKEIDGKLVPGALEGSNVNAVMAMVELVRVQRSFESAKKAIDTYRDMDRRLQHNVAD